MNAWKKGGAKVGWQSNAGFREAQPKDTGNKGDVPAFRFSAWKDGLLVALPAPEQAFGLALYSTSLTDTGLKEIARLKQLRILNLGNTQVTDAGLTELTGLGQLEILSLSGNNVTGKGLKAVTALKQLRSLNLSSTKVTDASLKDLAGLERLETLDLRNTPLTDGVLKSLAGLKSLHTLNLEGANISDALLQELRGLKQLRSLNLVSTNVTDAGLKELAKMDQLAALDLTSSKVTETGAAELRKALPKAKIVRSPWEKKTYTNAIGQKMPYRLLPPEDPEPQKAYPLIVFMDGIGSRGTDNEKQLGNASLLTVKKNRQKFPCFVVAPQCPGGKDFPFWNQGVHSGLAMGVIEEVEKSYRIDPARIYVTGLSDGGYGVYFLLNLYPEVFAAAVPIAVWTAGAIPPAKIAHVPLWAFQGEKDSAKWTREMVAALKKAGGEPKYTEYPNAGHGIWGRAYGEPELFEWLFAQKNERRRNSLQSFNFPNGYIRHQGFLGFTTEVRSDIDRRLASWYIEPGLAGGQTVSFRATNDPRYYLRSQEFRLKMYALEPSDAFKKEASFKRVKGLAKADWASFESVNFPDHFIRHRNGDLWADKNDGSDLFKKDATFRIVDPLFRPR